jgi:hypothetical protein
MCCTVLVWIAGCLNSSDLILTSHPPKRKMYTFGNFPTFLEPGSLKRGRFAHINLTSEEVGGLDIFLYEADQNFEH